MECRHFAALLAAVAAALAGPATAAAVTCSFNGTTRILSVTIDDQNGTTAFGAIIRARTSGDIAVDPVTFTPHLTTFGGQIPCAGPPATVNNTDAIDVTGGTGEQPLVLGAGLAPGNTTEATGTSEIEVYVNLGAHAANPQYGGDAVRQPDSTLTTIGSLASTLTAANDDGDNDADVFMANVELVAVDGTSGDDVIRGDGGAGTGGPANVPILADLLGGKDTFVGGDANDIAYGDDGKDVLEGGLGNDWLDGGYGSDYILGEADDDHIDGGDGNDNVNGGPDKDRVSGDDGRPNYRCVKTGPSTLTCSPILPNTGNDLVTGGPGEDTLSGNDGNDTLDGGADGDFMFGDEGNDLLRSGPGDDALFGGNGVDTADFSTAPNGIVATFPNGSATGDGTDAMNAVENAYGSAFDDRFTGGVEANRFDGRDGGDVLIGGGNDALFGGYGEDVVDYTAAPGPVNVNLATGIATGEGSDTIQLASVEEVDGSAFDDTITGDAGGNFLFGNAGDDTISAGDGDDAALGGAGKDTLRGDAGPDALQGDAGDDTLFGGADNDRLAGGAGNDELAGDDGVDMVDYSASPSAVVVALYAGWATGEGSDTLATIEDVNGSSYADTLMGDGGPNEIFGSAGMDGIAGFDANDYLDGGTDDDILNGGPDDDTLVGGDGFDFVNYETAPGAVYVNLPGGAASGDGTDTLGGVEGALGSNYNDTLLGDGNDNDLIGYDGIDSVAGGGGDDYLTGDAGDDTLSGNDGNDSLDGGAGADSLTGGAGGDTLDGGNEDDGLDGGAGNATLLGRDGSDVLAGGSEDDMLTGGAGGDTLQGGDGNDLLAGGDGIDTLMAGAGNDALDGGDDSDFLFAGAGDDAITG